MDAAIPGRKSNAKVVPGQRAHRGHDGIQCLSASSRQLGSMYTIVVNVMLLVELKA